MKQLKIKIKNKQKEIIINKKIITRLAKQILKTKGIEEAELSILFTTKEHIRALNRRFRNKNQATDVLAFSMHEGKDAQFHPEVLGDVVICPEIARKRAKIYKTSSKSEIALYLTHGILHLLGYDDVTNEASLRIQKEQTRILNKIIEDAKAKYL